MNYLQIDYIIIGDAAETQLNLLELAANYCGTLGMRTNELSPIEYIIIGEAAPTDTQMTSWSN